MVGLYLLGGLYLSFYRFFCTSLPTFSVGLFRFSFVKFNIIQGCVFVNTFLEIFYFIFNIFTVLAYFYIFRHFIMYCLSFSPSKKTPASQCRSLSFHFPYTCCRRCSTSSRSGIALAAPSLDTAMLAAILAMLSALTESCSFRYSAMKYPV